MLPGLSGTLVSSYFAEALLAGEFAGRIGESSRDAARAKLLRWRRGPSRRMGPVDGARTIFDLAVVPLASALGLEPSIDRASRDGACLVGRLDGGFASRADRPSLLVTAWAAPLDAAWRKAAREMVAAGAAWCLATNGCSLRLVDARMACARRFAEFDLGCALDDPASFAVLWALCRRDAFVRPSLVAAIAGASARHGVSVSRSLRHGVLRAMDALLAALDSNGPPRGERTPAEHERRAAVESVHEQALTIVYRILFLLFAESRGLVPLWHPVYRESYSMESLLDRAAGPGRAPGLWDQLRAISRLAHAGCRAGTLRVTAFNGRLFAPSAAPLADSCRIDDETTRGVLAALATTPRAGGAPARIAYRDLGVEQLGAVYESILDYRAEAVPAGGRADSRRRQIRLVAGRAARKATGTFYTPRSLTTYLVRQTLAPLVSGASPDQVLSLRVVDPAMGSGAFLVAACRFLASAYESATIEAGGCHPSDISDADRRMFRRLVAERCLFGVDRNPMAVQLARLSLWLCTLAPDRPLTFLDHHLVAGDSLVGAALADLRRRPPGGGDRARQMSGVQPPLPLFDDERLGPFVRDVLPAWGRLSQLPDDSLAVVREKERLLARVAGPASPLSAWKAAADLWCAFAFREGTRESHARLFPALSDLLLTGRTTLPRPAAESWLIFAREVAAERRFFHWPFEFPEVFYAGDGSPDPRGGFDAVIGNPPWEMVREDGEGGGDGSARHLLTFARSSGIYRAQGDGHANLFQLFVERACQLARTGGRIGLVVPWGLASDRGCAPLRRLLLDRCRVDALVGFDNAAAVFPIHRGLRFLLLTASAGSRTAMLPCRFGIRDPDVLESAGEEGGAGAAAPCVTIPRSLVERLSPGQLAIPDVRSALDLALLEKTASVAPPIASAEGWHVEFGRELNASDDRRHFVAGGEGLPVLEGKHVTPFRVTVPRDGRRLPLAAARRLLDERRAWGRARLAYRDVASATNALTLIAAVVPAGHVTVHTLFCLRTALPAVEQDFLCGVLNSLVANYLVRLRVSLHVTAGVISELPVPRPERSSPALATIAALSGRLRDSPAPLQDPAYAELQAGVARLYQLTGDEFRHILDTFPLVEDRTKAETLRIFEKEMGAEDERSEVRSTK